ncbi:Platelet-activating factor acetylhydrolase protein [Rutstroemia sp. NJR-2017a BVV2]|nr:Platelet-activating factor acetylhydrolase protein [Rutstroemia sp. NJR-2017a BVV2]
MTSPVPGFADYTGPHKVGTIDVEIPVSELDPPSSRTAPGNDIPTIQYRIFYPCEPDAKGKSVNWIPRPQRDYISAYSRFLGAGSTLAEFISYFPRLLHYVTIPVRKDAPLLQPNTSNKRWPVMVFSHGLGGSRNAYSHLVGSIASHGMIVIAPEHRDGSTPISYIREPPANDSTSEKHHKKQHARTVDYIKLSHTPSPEVEEGRNAQLKIRLWEMGLIHDSLLKLDEGKSITNLNASSTSLSIFKGRMNVHEPGKIAYAGHSFGAATIVQFIKSVFYASETSSAPSSYKPLFIPSTRSAVCQQITPQNPIILLDCWCFPLRSASTRWLWNRPLPCYAPGGPGGSAIVAVESQAFYKWTEHLKATKRLLSANPASSTPSPMGKSPPHFYYPATSAHLSQSDFGVLFPWVTKRVFAAEEPERIMRLNVRAILQLLRERGIEVSKTSSEDMELEVSEDGETDDDKKIFGKDGAVRGWIWLDVYDGQLAGSDSDSESELEEHELKKEPNEAVMGNEVQANTGGLGGESKF